MEMDSHGNSRSGQQQKRILIIDDEDYGFKTDSYTDPVLALKNFKSGQYDLIILDIKMPIIDGFLLYQNIKTTDSKVEICFLTATEYFREEIRKEHGFDEFNQELFLRKPIEIEELVYQIKRMLAIASSQF